VGRDGHARKHDDEEGSFSVHNNEIFDALINFSEFPQQQCQRSKFGFHVRVSSFVQVDLLTALTAIQFRAEPGTILTRRF
jgi:hypothetical protein